MHPDVPDRVIERSAAHPPVPDQSRRQCDQVHARGRDRDRGVHRRRARWQACSRSSKCATPASASRPTRCRTLFQPFVQADASTTRHFGGTGLGLSIVRRLVEMMGGEVGATSELGKGSTFWFTLPLEPAAASGGEAPIDLPRLGRRVLVVDDNETNRRVLAGQLMHAGFEVSLAAGGIEAISMLRQALADNHPFEVVLADYQMHDMDGAVLGERINADRASVARADRDADLARSARRHSSLRIARLRRVSHQAGTCARAVRMPGSRAGPRREGMAPAEPADRHSRHARRRRSAASLRRPRAAGRRQRRQSEGRRALPRAHGLQRARRGQRRRRRQGVQRGAATTSFSWTCRCR